MADLAYGIKETGKNIFIANKHFSITLDKDSGSVTEFVNLYTNKNILSKIAPILYIQNKDKTDAFPKGVRIENGNLIFDFVTFPSVELKIEVFDNFMTFEVLTQLPKTVYSIVFANFDTDFDTDEYRFNAMGMTAWILMKNGSPCGDFKSHNGVVYTHFEPGTAGSKIGIAFSQISDSVKHVQEIADAIDPSVGLYSKAGGPYSKEWERNSLDYALFFAVKDDTIDDAVRRYNKYGVDELDIHMSEVSTRNTFLQGSFKWVHYKDHKEFYERFGKKLHDNGIIYGLHSYSQYISFEAEEYTTNPHWQKQFSTIKPVYTLKEDVGLEGGDFPTHEDASGFIPEHPFHPYSRFLLIDEEIVEVDKYTENGFFGCVRGRWGTKPANHKAGTKVYQIALRYWMIIPQYGSELFYKVADTMANAYNEANFDMLYFDALDGMCYDADFFELPEKAYHYYSQMYIQRVISQCKRTPVFESAAGSTQELNVRGRIGAHDISVRGIKMTVKSHTEQNLGRTKACNVVGTLGWFTFFPDRDATFGMKNTIQKTIFHDDIDYVGLYSILYDQTMVHNPLPADNHPFHIASVEYFKKYGDLRKSNYFTQRTKDKLIEMGGEFKLVEKNGEYVWQQMSYNKDNLGNVVSEDSFSFTGSNPYKAQKPFIRLEQRWSTNFENELKLFDFDENKKLSEQTLLNNGLRLDLTNNMVLKVRVKGTGKDGDAMLLSVKGVPEHWSYGRVDNFIDLNFEGWREFVLLDADNAEYDIEKYNFGPAIRNQAGAWETIHLTPPYDQIGEINLYLTGDTAGNAQISSVYGYTQVQDSVINPTVSVGNTAITFNTTIRGGEYIEYEPDTNRAFLYHNLEQTVEEIDFTGEISVGEGEYTGRYTAKSETNAPLRAKVVLGFAGATVENIK